MPSTIPPFLFAAALGVSSLASAQWSTGATGATSAYIPPAEQRSLEDSPGEKPRSVFERAEWNLARSARPPRASAPGPAGTISVDELRHPLSGKGERLIQKGERHAQAGEHDKAIEQFKLALKETSSEPYARSLLGVEYLKLGDSAAAIPELSEAIRLMPRLAANHSNLGYAYCLTGKRDMAEQELRLAIRLDSTAARPRYLLGLILMDKKSSEAALHLRFAQSVVRPARLALAVFHLRHGESADSQQDLRAYLALSGRLDAAVAAQWVASAATMDQPSILFGLAAESRLVR